MTSTQTFPMTAGDINIFHARLIADQQITFVLAFSERLDRDRLAAAFAVLHQALPVLSSTVEVKGARFRRIAIPGYRPAVSTLNEPTDRMREIACFTGSPCDPECDPPARLLLLRGRDGDTLCFKIDHVVSDAAGLRYLLPLLAEAYTTGRITQPINRDRGFGQVIRRFSPLSIVRAASKANLPVPGAALIQGSLEAPQTFIEHVSIEADRFERMHREAKLAEATINDVLLAGLYQAAFERLPAGDTSAYPVMVPVDMRRYLPEGQRGVLANLSSAVYPSLAPIADETPGDTLNRVKACMGALKQDQPGLGAMLLMSVGALRGGKMIRDRYRRAAGRGSRFINFTNFGILEEGPLAFGRLSPQRAYGVGPIQYAPGVLIAITTYRGALHLVVQGRGNERFRGFVREFLEALLHRLP